MAGQVLTSKVTQASNTVWQNKAFAAANAVGRGISVAQGIREALPVIGGVARAAAGYMPLISAPFGL